jgi:hypothetical protein
MYQSYTPSVSQGSRLYPVMEASRRSHMKRRALFVVAVLSLGLSLHSAPAAAQASKIATSLGDLRWGMSEHDVQTFVKRKIDEKLDEDLKKASSARKDKLRADAKRAKDQVDHGGIVRFEGSAGRWNSSVIAGEFRTGNEESMISYDDGSSQNYYFFVGGHLWKWYKAFDTGNFGGGSFKSFQSSIEKKFGKGHAKSGELNPGQGKTQWIEFVDRNSRLRAADNSKHGVYALIFEEMATVRELAALRPSQPRRMVEDDDAADESPKSTTREEVARAEKRRSIFADEGHTETDAEYNARKAKMAKEAREQQQAIHARKEDAKKGEVVKGLDHVNDADPLSGL